ncbi:hypothetical protein PENARI_c005G00511 [Penicillium arizonense]|uniref:FAD-binding domain-containing protein n=1 Tax=Penicillium arizonense TaxID=1835702 RepID=A0A1F5LPX9_PENAI|nr:hypothetical protein PENARI_c005G00511 [Penicillium arizonense]OGE54989.1 hypothetical protein PENARI_c005G00511 [Penicillium arizonense]
MGSSKKVFRVIIVGAAVSGLSLAHMLERAGIDFVLLERGEKVAFSGGASIGLQPNALRIMDQLGLYEEIYASTVPVETAFHRRSDGSVISASKFAHKLERRHGYPILFLEREELLEILYRNLRGKSKIFCSHKVVDIQCDQNRTIAVTDNGATFEGDIIIGADGVHSFTRQAIWNKLETTEPQVAKREATSMMSEYSCVFGVSTFVSDDPELVPGTSHITYSEKRSGICVVTDFNKKFWFLILRLEKTYKFPHIPRYSKQDIEDTLSKNADLQVTHATTLGDLAGNRSKLAMVSLEEAAFDRWFSERIAILGDAAHKVTPNAGHGGNTAIESATVLANLLYEAKKSTKFGSLQPSYNQVTEVLQHYQDARNERVMKAYTMSSMATRFQATQNILWKIVGTSIMPLFGEEAEVNASTELLLGGPPLKFIPYKGRQGSIPWDGWTPQSMAKDVIAQSSFLVVLKNSSNFLTLLTAVAFVRQYLWGFSPNISKPFARTACDPDIFHSNLETFLSFLTLLPFGTIGAIEILRTKNLLLKPLVLPVAYAAWFVDRKVLWAWLALLATSIFRGQLLFPQAYGYTITISDSYLIYRAQIASVILVGGICSPILGALWPNTTLSDFTGAMIVGFGLACPLVAPTLVALFNSAIGRNSVQPMYGHQDLPRIKQAYTTSFAISTVCHWMHLVAVQFGKEFLWNNYLSMANTGLFLSFLSCLWNTPSRHQSITFKLQFALGTIFLAILFGPGGTAALLWLWREDKIRCRE